MPRKMKDKHSGAILFVPTTEELAIKDLQKENEEMKERLLALEKNTETKKSTKKPSKEE